MLKFLRLQQLFDARAMQAELAGLDSALWSQHYNSSMYAGNWTVLPLRSLGGSIDNIISIHQGANDVPGYRNTKLLEQCPYIQSVLDYFECEKTAVRLMKLEAGAVIKEHSDHALSFEEGEVRMHIPVVTDPAVEFWLDNERIMMQEGACWYLNLSLKHAVYNRSATDRVHLVIDMKVNDWLKKLFAEKAVIVKELEDRQAAVYSKAEQLQIIAQLRSMNTETSLALAANMEKEIV